MSTHGVSFHAQGMHCPGCEHIIEDSARKLPGVQRIKADYPTETVAVVFDPASTKIEEICAAIGAEGLPLLLAGRAEAPPNRFKKLGRFILGIVGIVLLIFLDTKFISQSGEPDISLHMGLAYFRPWPSDGFSLYWHVRRLCSELHGGDARLGRRSYLSHLSMAPERHSPIPASGRCLVFLGAVVAFTPLLRGAAGVISPAYSLSSSA